jgi:hypothetical protein
MTWLVEILRALRALGGEARLTPDLYGWIRANCTRQFPSEWQSLIRATLQAHCRTSPQFKPGNADLFRNTARGWWAIRSVEPAKGAKLRMDDLRALAISQMTKADFHDLNDSNVHAAIDGRALVLKEWLIRGEPAK